jgi:non-ribosomal peptide synthetase component E (peptide arylation enzyme)
MENEIRANDPGITDAALQQAIYDMDDDIVSYVNIDDIEDKISALESLMKMSDADGNDIVDTAQFGVSDTVPREELMRDMKYTIKQYHPEVYDKLFMYDVGEETTFGESTKEE